MIRMNLKLNPALQDFIRDFIKYKSNFQWKHGCNSHKIQNQLKLKLRFLISIIICVCIIFIDLRNIKSCINILRSAQRIIL